MQNKRCNSRSPGLARTRTHRLTAHSKSSAQLPRGKNVAIVSKKIRKLNDLPRIVYLPPDLLSNYILGYAISAFANKAGCSSLIGWNVLLKQPRSHHYLRLLETSACYPNRFGVEVHAFPHCLYFVLTLSHDLSAILQQKMCTVIFTDAKCLFDTTEHLSKVSQKRQLIDAFVIQEVNCNGYLTNVSHVASKHNFADTYKLSNADTTMSRQPMRTETINDPLINGFIYSNWKQFRNRTVLKLPLV